ncbi:MAG: DNA primase [Ruminococcus sp.]|nr:DNA primase [Ruminococcus sp.]
MLRNDEFLDTLRRENPVENVIGSYIQVKKRGRNYLCSCPFHSEKTPSCTIFPETQTFYCFGCGAGGDVITFIMKIENLDFVEAVKSLAQRAGLEMPVFAGNPEKSQLKTKIYEMNRLAANFFYNCLIKGGDCTGREYFSRRKISPQTVKKYGLGYAPNGWTNLVKFLNSKGYSDDEISSAWLGGFSQKTGNIFDIFRKRVIFPIIDVRKNVIGFGGRVLDDSKPKYINTADTLVFDKGVNLFSLNFARNTKDKKFILCEGYMDVIALNQAGFENAVATLGTAITPAQARIISHYAEEVIIAYDSDDAGQNASRKAIQHLNDAGVRTRVLKMTGAKDPDEFIKKFGRERFSLLINNSADSINFMLDNCENSLDLETESGRAELIRRTAHILADIKSRPEREIYISRTAEKCRIPVETLKIHIEGIIKNSRKNQAEKQWNDTVSGMINSAKNQHSGSKITNAEEYIICYIIKRPEDFPEILKLIPPENFRTDFNKKIYSALTECMKNNEIFSVSMLNSFFSPEEMGKISGISARNYNVEINMDVIKECAETLRKQPDFKSGDELSDDDLKKLFASKVNK